MQIEFILLAFLFNYLRKQVREKDLLPGWQKIFLVGFVVTLVMLILDITNRDLQHITVWFGHALIWIMVSLIVTVPEFKSVKSKLYIYS